MTARKKITYKDVSDYFLAFANDVGQLITNLKLQKLVYYAQAWYLANYGKPLFDSDFQAWVHGPVIPDLYHEMKAFGYNPIIQPLDIKKIEKRFDADTLDFLKEVVDVYMPYEAYDLERMVHREQPWIQARDGCAPDEICTNMISKESMGEFYAKRLQEA